MDLKNLDVKKVEEFITQIFNLYGSSLKKQEIINYLELFIKTNGSKFGMNNAVSKWQNDLNFVREYNMEWQDDFDIDEVRRY